MSAPMKASGVGWIGDVQEHWQICRVKDVTTCLDSKRVPISAQDRETEGGTTPYWGANNILDYVNGFLLDEEVVLLGEDGAPFLDNTKDVAFHSIGKIWPNNHIHVLRPSISTHASYLRHTLNCVNYESVISGSTRMKLTQGEMKLIEIPLPPLPEQIAIADYLDKTTALIDKQRALLERKKALLQEHKKALIHEAVTKGIRQGVAMKPSGVNWIGDVPNHWDINRVKDLATIVNGDWGEDPADDDGMVCYRKADFSSQGYVVFGNTKRLISRPAFVGFGDILIEKSGGGEKNPVGAIALVVAHESAACSNFLARIRCKKGVDSEFIFNVLVSQYQSSHIYNLFKQTTGIQNVDMQAFQQCSLPLPPLAEQGEISSYLKKITFMIDRSESLLTKRIKVLNELRASLIHEAVTQGVPP